MEPLRVMKFGGTSMGDASCIERAAKIVIDAIQDGPIVVVVSAMEGITNCLIRSAHASANGEVEAADELGATLRQKHLPVVETLISDKSQAQSLAKELEAIIEQLANLCHGMYLLRELTPRTLDAISSGGERLSSRLLAGKLNDLGNKAIAVEATEVIVTDNVSGRAEPLIPLTRDAAAKKLWPLLEEQTIPIVTGFVGATAEGMLTTLGRGGSDYSATTLAAALDAKEVIIWTDVDGVLTADPRLVKDARTLDEVSYDEAAELAYFGAKVLHPKTLRPVSEAGIPVWIRNSFAADRQGTKITREGHPTARGVKAITSVADVTLITVGGRGIVGLPGVAGKTFTAAAAAQANVLLISQSSSENDICFIINSADAVRTVEQLRLAFAHDLAHRQVEHITVDPDIAIVAVVGDKMRGMPGIAGRIFSTLGDRGINIIAIAQGSSEFNVSFVVEAYRMKETVQSLHHEFALHKNEPG